MDTSVQTKMDALLRCMEPIIASERIYQQADVCLDRLNNNSLVTLGDVLPKVIEDVASLALSSGRFQLVQLNFVDTLTIRCDADVDKLCKLLGRAPLTIGRLQIDVKGTNLSTSARAKMVLCLLGLDLAQAKSPSAIAAGLTHATSLEYFHWLDTGGHVLLDRLLPRSYTQTQA